MVLLYLVSVGVDLVEVMLSVSSVNGFGQNMAGTFIHHSCTAVLTSGTGGPGGRGEGIVRQAGQLVCVLCEVRNEPVKGAAAVANIADLLCMSWWIERIPSNFNFISVGWCWRRDTLGPCVLDFK
jgi:hypothetical protein